MNKKLKIALITSAVAGALYGTYKLYIHLAVGSASGRWESNENDGKKKMLVNYVLTNKGLPITDSNINKYMQYSEDELAAMLEPDPATNNLTEEQVNDDALNLLSTDNIEKVINNGNDDYLGDYESGEYISGQNNGTTINIPQDDTLNEEYGNYN
jgi:hypothetical protein